MAHALIIDDNAGNLTVLAQLLQREGLSSTPVPHPARLADAIESLPELPAIVFVDLEMPGANGYDVLASLRADSRFDAVPIVACTVHSGEINTAYQQGFTGFIPKPLDVTRFPDQLARLLSGEPVWEQV